MLNELELNLAAVFFWVCVGLVALALIGLLVLNLILPHDIGFTAIDVIRAAFTDHSI